MLGERMVLDIVDNVLVMGELSGRLDRFGAGILGDSILEVPVMGSVQGSLEALELCYNHK